MKSKRFKKKTKKKTIFTKVTTEKHNFEVGEKLQSSSRNPLTNNAINCHGQKERKTINRHKVMRRRWK